MTNRSSLILMVSSLAGAVPSCACTYAPNMAIETSAASAVRRFIEVSLSWTRRCYYGASGVRLTTYARLRWSAEAFATAEAGHYTKPTLHRHIRAFAVERDQVHALWRLHVQLPQHGRDLTAMIRAMIDQVLQHLPERLRLASAVPPCVFDRPRNAVGSER